MGLSDKKEKQLRVMPKIESKYSTSKDGRFIIHRTIITTIKPKVYFEKMMEEEELTLSDFLSAADELQTTADPQKS